VSPQCAKFLVSTTAGGISGTGLLERAIHLMFEALFRHPETQRSTVNKSLVHVLHAGRHDCGAESEISRPGCRCSPRWEFLEGETWSELLRKGSLAAEQLLNCAYDLVLFTYRRVSGIFCGSEGPEAAARRPIFPLVVVIAIVVFTKLVDLVVLTELSIVAVFPNIAAAGIEERVVTAAIRELDAYVLSLGHGGLRLKDWFQYNDRKKQSDECEDRLRVKINAHVSGS
jgi:hypothetical protein